MNASVDEQDLIQKILTGDTDAYAELVRGHQSKILGLCASLLGDLTQAEDAAQEVFIKAYQSLRIFRRDSAFSTWVYRIAVNHCKDLLRKRARLKTESLDVLIEESGETFAGLWESRLASDDKDASDWIEKLLSLLSPDERLILTLREVQGLTYDEISDTLKCSLDAVKSRLRRARQVLAEKVRHFSRMGNV